MNTQNVRQLRLSGSSSPISPFWLEDWPLCELFLCGELFVFGAIRGKDKKAVSASVGGRMIFREKFKEMSVIVGGKESIY